MRLISATGSGTRRFPLSAYAALLIGGLLLFLRPEPALFVVAAAALALLFDGIHNAWDSVTFIVVNHSRHKREKSNEENREASSEAPERG